MKVTDMFTLYHRDNPPPPADKDSGVRPVPVVDKISLQPGQLFRGEVLGEDGKGHLLLKVGGEIIATRGLLSMTTGQQIWVEVKEVGDSPLFALAQAKGAVHELLKNIMEVRPAVLVQGKGETVVPPEFQAPPAPPAEVSFVPKLAPLNPDGGLPRETMQLFKALLALPKADIPPLPEAKMQQLAPFLSEATGKVDLRQVVSMLNQTGKIPPVLSEIAPLRPLFVFAGSVDKAPAAVPPMAEQPQTKVQIQPAFTQPLGSVAVTQAAKSGPQPVPFITADGQVVSHAVQLVRSLVETVALLPQTTVKQDADPMAQVTKGFSDLLKSILVKGEIPKSLRSLEPMRHLQINSAGLMKSSTALLSPVTSDELIQGFSQTAIQGSSLSPTLQNETVAKVLSGLQGAEPKPELIRVLKQLLSASQFAPSPEDDEVVHHDKKSAESLLGLSKAASFFKSQALVNHEVAQVSQGDCVLIPCFFAGQSGWGEWLWSHEHSEAGQEPNQENLAFFLEMSNLGPVSIQAILGEKSLSGQFRVADDTAYQAIVQALPELEERLTALGYKTNITCLLKPVAVLQEMKDSLESRTMDLTPSSLVDIQA